MSDTYYSSFGRRANLSLIRLFFKFHKLSFCDASAQSAVCIFISVRDDAGTRAPSSFNHSTSYFVDIFSLRVACIVESTHRFDDSSGWRHRQLENNTSSRRMYKLLRSNIAYDEGQTTAAPEYFLDRFRDLLM